MSSQAMKQLRVLTGRHAGAQLVLSASTYRIAADDQADIQIVDWQQEPIVLELQEDGQVIALTLQAQDNAASTTTLPRIALEDFLPARFVDIVLCVGPKDAAWPSDMQLLEQMMRPPTGKGEAEAAPPAGRTRLRAAAIGIVASVAIGAAFLTVVSQHTRAATKQAIPEPLVGQVHRAIESASLAGVIARPAGEQVVVEGLLANAADAIALRQLLSRFPADRIEQRYAAASDIAQSISDALQTPGLAVAYRGDGFFVVTGHAMHLDDVRAAAARIAADLAPQVRGIELAATEAPAPDRVPVGAMLSSDGLQYVQTRDGVKHLSLTPEPIVELPDAAATPSR